MKIINTDNFIKKLQHSDIINWALRGHALSHILRRNGDLGATDPLPGAVWPRPSTVALRHPDLSAETRLVVLLGKPNRLETEQQFPWRHYQFGGQHRVASGRSYQATERHHLWMLQRWTVYSSSIYADYQKKCSALQLSISHPRSW